MFRKAVRTHVLKKKEDFLGSLLQETIQKQRDEIRNALMKFPYFHNWPEQKVHQCCVHSNIMCYSENEIIRVKDDANVYVTHFVLEGKVTVVQRLLVHKLKNKGNSKNCSYKLSKKQDDNLKSKVKLESVYMQVCHLLKGATFGLGEELCKHIIIAGKNTKCLLVPRHIILQHYSLDNVWQKIILFLDTVYPSTEEVFQQFILGRKRKKYSEELYQSVAEKARPTNLCIHDVPLSCRANDIKLARFYKKAEKDPLYLIGDRCTGASFLEVIESEKTEANDNERKRNP